MSQPIKIDRKLPPHELNARRARKRIVTQLPAVACLPDVPEFPVPTTITRPNNQATIRSTTQPQIPSTTRDLTTNPDQPVCFQYFAHKVSGWNTLPTPKNASTTFQRL
jgi:hypothetical protein